MSDYDPAEGLLAAVASFHKTMGLPIATGPTALAPQRLEARASWLEEEVREFRSARSLITQLDATLDVIYLAIGNLVEMGVELGPAFQAVHSANLRKRWPRGSVQTDGQGKLLKPPDWVGPEDDLRRLVGRGDSED